MATDSEYVSAEIMKKVLLHHKRTEYSILLRALHTADAASLQVMKLLIT
jgi:hypothetical protein